VWVVRIVFVYTMNIVINRPPSDAISTGRFVISVELRYLIAVS
jgi:hypothetical protein